ncbi:MAG: pseudouridine synthase [Motiliproteus sp.]|nr:pseudouridine synthase [Motiliproteus sp.]MCW9053178.1 pseudouridine synthase [Motiliproteus sp.]
MRLDRFVCRATGLGRSQVHRLLRSGEVEVDGVVAKKASTQLKESADVWMFNQQLRLPEFCYLMLNKPQGVVCATEDGEYPTVLDLLPEEMTENPKGQLHPAGRLDVDTTGLVLITDDGRWSHNLTSPRKQCFKRYRVTLDQPLKLGAEQQLEQGVMLRGEDNPTLPARIELADRENLIIEISEGRYHQVKRMFAAMENRVVALHREAVGSIELDLSLAEGECRPLTETEIAPFLDLSSDK